MKILLLFFVFVVLMLVLAFRRLTTGAPVQDIGEMMKSLADQAVAVAAQNLGLHLDYSPRSLERTEEALARIHEQYCRHKSEEAVHGLAMAFGAYIGEVIRRSEDGSDWAQDHPIAGQKSYPLSWAGGQSFPCAWSYKRIVNGPEDNIWHKYQILKAEREKAIPPAQA